MKSMTAYANVLKCKDGQGVQLTLRSTNFKYLDISIHNLPNHDVLLEEKIKREIKKKMQRGKVEVYIFFKHEPKGKASINEKLLAQYISEMKKLSKKYKVEANLTMGDFLHLPGVTYLEEEKRGVDNLVFLALKEGLDKLVEFKQKEGKAIEKEMLKNLKKLGDNVKTIIQNKPLARNGDAKEDIDEEVSLISFYLKGLEQKIRAPKEALKGKSIDFLTQEILRELNAASSKTKQKQLASMIVESKNYLERIREQAQNVE